MVQGRGILIVRIKDIILRTYMQPLPATLRNAARRPLKKEILVVVIQVHSGAKGYGECWTAGYGMDVIADIVRNRLKSEILGMPLREAREYLQSCLHQAVENNNGAMAAAVSGLDCASWDAEANDAEVPLYELLGGRRRDVYAYASGGLYYDNKGATELKEEVQESVSMGFDAVKIKVAGLPLERDIERVRAVRNVLGPQVRLMVDANGAYSDGQAAEFSEAISDQDIYWFEEPCEEGLPELRKNCRLPICGFERNIGKQSFAELINLGLLDFAQFDLSICGGITEALKILDVVGKIPVTLHGSSSVVLFFTNLQFACAFRQVESVEYHRVHQWPIKDIESPGVKVNSGIIQLPAGKGIGVRLS